MVPRNISLLAFVALQHQLAVIRRSGDARVFASSIGSGGPLSVVVGHLGVSAAAGNEGRC